MNEKQNAEQSQEAQAAGSKLKATVRPCPECGGSDKPKHLHELVHGLPGTHMGGTERFECSCGHWFTRAECADRGFKFILDTSA